MNEIPRIFVEVSRSLGADPLLIQGAGGNSSVKTGDSWMWVKASGKWLMHAGTEDVFVAVDPTVVNANIKAGMDEPTAGAVLPAGNSQLRPSIETTLHSLMPHQVVFHTHSINTIAHAIRRDAADVLADKLAGLQWNLVPYSQPGLPLTQLVAGLLGDKACDVLVIQNHGLVVGGNSPSAALALMQDVEQRLACDPHPMVSVDLAGLEAVCAGTDFKVADTDLVHQLALPDGGFEVACRGSLYPDHVVFLGSAIAGVESPEELKAFCGASSDDPLRPAAVALQGCGVVHRQSLTAGGLEMLKALAEVCRRTPDPDNVNYLTRTQEEALVNWDAEKYRQTL